MNKEVIILGVGLTTPVFMELAIDAGYKIKGLYHYNEDRNGQIVHGYQIIGSFDDLFQQDIQAMNFMLTMGNLQIRKELSEKIKDKGGILPTIIHPTAIISKFCEISKEGVLVGPLAIIQADVEIERGVVIRDGALICHTTKINEYVFVGPQSLIGANIKIEPLAFIGQRALLVSGKATTIGRNSLIGAGAVVTKPIESNKTVVGFPAKELR